jgi:hypothetical protein
MPPSIPRVIALDAAWQLWLGTPTASANEAWALIVQEEHEMAVRLSWSERALMAWSHSLRPELLPDGLRLHRSESAETILRLTLTLPRRTRLAADGAVAAVQEALETGLSPEARDRLALVRQMEPLLETVALRASAQRLLQGVLDAEDLPHGKVLADAKVKAETLPPVTAHARLALRDQVRQGLARRPEGTGLRRLLGV